MNRLLKTMVTSLLIILTIVAIIFVVYLNVNADGKDENPTIDDIIEYSYESPEVTTDLIDGSFVRIQFQIVTDSKDAREEISKRDFQIKNILIKELSKMDQEQFQTSLDELEDIVQEKLNEIMVEGTINDVYTINKILQ
ncbi:flagellar basal body-associated protein FliL [Ornithinibacillus halophilus]|uniref:Flagellar protein FliL n=1 Tax=Ornithinibacillus halophilus TaxID=930117 RepID=A0A1M5CBG1_9BACI|nr:flagellar basal body-associated protein FliL [Ornithinibacillus halophilus]SHF51752.1 flagellar FliL protein [Ornithinibacillus halophilus]